MSARAELRREMTHNHLYMTDERADELIDAYAHELAEEQRAYAREVGLPLEDGNIVSAGDVIDLIDPRVGGTLTVLAAVHGGPCRATLQGWPEEVVDECVREAGHYDEADPESWHEAEPEPGGSRRRWSDSASGATPHRAGPARPDEEPEDDGPEDGGHDFQWGDDRVQRCTRCTLPHSRWSGGPCPGPDHPLRPGEYV